MKESAKGRFFENRLMEVGWGGEGGMVFNIVLLASHLSHLTRYHRPQKVILPKNTDMVK